MSLTVKQTKVVAVLHTHHKHIGGYAEFLRFLHKKSHTFQRREGERFLSHRHLQWLATIYQKAAEGPHTNKLGVAGFIYQYTPVQIRVMSIGQFYPPGQFGPTRILVLHITDACLYIQQPIRVTASMSDDRKQPFFFQFIGKPAREKAGRKCLSLYKTKYLTAY